MRINHASRPDPFCSPCRKRDHDGLQILAFAREPVLAVLGMRALLGRLHEAGRDKILQSLRKNVRSDPKSALKLREAREAAKHRVPQDEEAPALADKLQRPRHRAILIFIEPSEHAT